MCRGSIGRPAVSPERDPGRPQAGAPAPGICLAGSMLFMGILAAGPIALASEPRSWELEGFAARKAGELEDVSLAWDGTIQLAPRRELLHKWPSAQVWTLGRDRSGALYAGTGNDGLLFRLEPGKEPVPLLDAEEPIVQALVVDAEGRVLAGTSPGGKVYRVDRAGKAEVFFDPAETYIWALSLTAQGDLLVATGDPAVIYRVSRRGEAQPILRSQERHFRSLAVGPAGDIYAGTSENAYIYRITARGEAYVLHDAPGREVSALAVDPSGALYAAALGGTGTPVPEPAPAAPAAAEPESAEPDATVTVTVSASADEESAPAAPPRSQAAAKATRGGRGTEIFRVLPDGFPESLWRSGTDLVYALAVDDGGDLLASVGEPAAILRINPQGKSGQWARLEGAQVTHLLRAGAGEWIAATSNLGSVIRLGPGRAALGTYTSPAKDAEIFSEWGRLRWESEVPRGAVLEMEARSGNTETPGETWSAWRPLAPGRSTEAPVGSPPGRFVQWRARLRSERGEAGPSLKDVELFFRQRNVAPEIASIRIEDPGVVIQPVSVSPPPSAAGGQPGGRGGGAQSPRPRTTRRTFEKGRQTISWTGRDRNHDTLKYDVYYRRQEESIWTPLKMAVEDEFHAFDTTSLPDGRYRVRIVASDRPSNPPAEAQSGESESNLFIVDNTPPRVDPVRAGVTAGKVELSFEVTDTFSPVESAEYALNGGEWMALNPQDGVADSPREVYRTEVEIGLSGEHTLGVRAMDQMGNRGAGYVRVEVP